MTQTPMSDVSLDRLETLLEEPPAGADPLWLDSLQGFLAAVISSPSPIPRKDWLTVALGPGKDWDAEPGAAELVGLVDKLVDDITLHLGEGGGLPLLVYPADETGERFDYEPWAAGYLEGVSLATPGWFEVGDEDVVDELTFPLAVLSGGMDDDDELLETLKEEGKTLDDLRVECAEELPLTIQQAFDYWFEHRKPATVRRDAPKVGRNDPCTCGSGKKYKQCCGSGTETSGGDDVKA